MNKSRVFISHIGDESDIAIEFKALIENAFLGLIDVFVSSDGSSIKMGQKWLDDISGALSNCSVEIVICSPVSVKKPWINFEAGAGWVRGIPVIPLCHSGMIPSNLPVPLNLLQAASATDVSGLKLIFPVLANAIGSKTPSIDFSGFIAKTQEFERRYTFWKQCNDAFMSINELNAGIIGALRSGKKVVMDLTDIQINALEISFRFLSANNILAFRRLGSTQMTSMGVFYDCGFEPLFNFANTVSDSQFKFH